MNGLDIGISVIGICFGFRDSDFEIRIFRRETSFPRSLIETNLRH